MKNINIKKKKTEIGAPKLITMFNGNGLDDPLQDLEGLVDELPPTEIVDREVSTILENLRQERKNRMERYREELDPHFYIVLCFQSQKQKEEFVKKSGWEPVEKDSLYFDGLEIADKLEIRLTLVKLDRKIGGKVTKRAKGMEVIDERD